MSIIIAVILAFIFTPIYEFFYKRLKSRNFAATIIVVALILIILIPIWFLLPLLIKETFVARQSLTQMDFGQILSSLFPKSESSQQIAREIGPNVNTFVNNAINSLLDSLIKIIFDFPIILLNIFVVFFSLFYFLRDKDSIIEYLKEILPFSKDIQERLFKHTSDVTYSILYGQVVVGIIQGIIAGIGFFLFGVPNALFLTFIAVILGILPIIGPAIAWIPVALFLFIGGNILQGWGVTFFGIIASNIDNFLRPIIVSRRTKIHSLVLLISMLGGFLFFGIMGFIIGPLVISYLLILLEVYKVKSTGVSIIQTKTDKNN